MQLQMLCNNLVIIRFCNFKCVFFISEHMLSLYFYNFGGWHRYLKIYTFLLLILLSSFSTGKIVQETLLHKVSYLLQRTSAQSPVCLICLQNGYYLYLNTFYAMQCYLFLTFFATALQ